MASTWTTATFTAATDPGIALSRRVPVPQAGTNAPPRCSRSNGVVRRYNGVTSAEDWWRNQLADREQTPRQRTGARVRPGMRSPSASSSSRLPGLGLPARRRPVGDGEEAADLREIFLVVFASGRREQALACGLDLPNHRHPRRNRLRAMRRRKVAIMSRSTGRQAADGLRAARPQRRPSRRCSARIRGNPDACARKVALHLPRGSRHARRQA